MRKFLPALFVVLALGAGGAAVYLFEKPSSGAGSTAAIAYLPADTLLLLAVPDLNKTCADFKGTDLYKIWSEPEMQSFLAKPLSKLPPHADLDEALALTGKLGLTDLFVALASMDEATNEPRVVAGFQFKGSSADVDRVLAKPKADLRKAHPTAKADLINYEGHPIETVSFDEHSSLASVYLGNWYLVANDLALLKTTIDRAENRGAAAGQPTLDKDADFAKVTAKLPASHATLIFGRPKAFLTKFLDLAAASGQTVEPKQRAEAEKIRALGATTGFENGKLRDTIYLYAPGISQEFAKLQMGSLPLTTADTVFYAASVLNIPAKFDLPGAPGADAGPGSTGLAFLQGLGELFAEHNVSLDAFRTAFGNEGSLHIDWPSGETLPTVVASLDVRDPAAANKFVDNLTAALTTGNPWEKTEADGMTFYSMQVSSVAGLAPTLTVTPKHLLLGLNVTELQAAAAREKTPTNNFTASDAYKKSSGDVEKPNTSFAYLDSKAFFERFYGTLKPYAVTAAFLLPQVNEYVDLGKLPEAETVAKHLSPTVLSQTYNPEGCLLESVGSFTFGQATVVIAGGAMGAAAQYMPKPESEEVEVTPGASEPAGNP